MQHRSLVVLSLMVVCASVPVPMVASCQGGGGAAPVGSTVSSGGSGGSSFAGFFDSGALGGMALEGGCADAGYDGPTGCEGIEGGVTYDQVGAIFTGCTGELCHSPPTYSTTVGVVAYECCDGRLLVDPGNAANSYLFDKVEGQDLCAGAPMPLGETPLSAAEILTLRQWICEGAPGP
jgi:hypothetical protein